MIAGCTEPVGNLRVELGDLAGLHREVVTAEQQPQLAAEHVQPFVSIVRLELWPPTFGWDQHLPHVHSIRMLGQWHDNACAALLRSRPDSRVTDLGRADEVVERDAIRLRDREQQLEARLALPCLESATACSSRFPSSSTARSASVLARCARSGVGSRPR